MVWHVFRLNSFTLGGKNKCDAKLKQLFGMFTSPEANGANSSSEEENF